MFSIIDVQSLVMIISTLRERKYLASILPSQSLNLFKTSQEFDEYFQGILEAQQTPTALFVLDAISRIILKSSVAPGFGDRSSYDSISAHLLASYFPIFACDTAIQYIASNRLDRRVRLSITYPIAYKEHFRWGISTCSLGYIEQSKTIVIFQCINRGERVELKDLPVMSSELLKKVNGVYREYEQGIYEGAVNMSDEDMMNDIGQSLSDLLFKKNREKVMKEVWGYALDKSNTSEKISKRVSKLGRRYNVGTSTRTINRMLGEDIRKYSNSWINEVINKERFLNYLERQKIINYPDEQKEVR